MTSSGCFARRSVVIVAVGLLTFAVARELVDVRPVILQRWTVLAVDAVIRNLYANATRDLAIHAVGTTAFRVRIHPGCSGVEGMTLGVALVVFYLVLARKGLRFPRALLLLPIVVLALAATNVARIVGLIVVGQRASPQAVDAFHVVDEAVVADPSPLCRTDSRCGPGSSARPLHGLGEEGVMGRQCHRDTRDPLWRLVDQIPEGGEPADAAVLVFTCPRRRGRAQA